MKISIALGPRFADGALFWSEKMECGDDPAEYFMRMSFGKKIPDGYPAGIGKMFSEALANIPDDPFGDAERGGVTTLEAIRSLRASGVEGEIIAFLDTATLRHDSARGWYEISASRPDGKAPRFFFKAMAGNGATFNLGMLTEKDTAEAVRLWKNESRKAC